MLYSSTYKTGYKGVLSTLAALIITTKVVAIMTDSNVSNSVEQGKEIWKDIEGYDGMYQVSNKGNIRSYHSNANSKNKRRKEPKNISKITRNNGYLFVNLCKTNHERKSKNIHRVVARAFIDNPQNKAQINHIDCNKENNHVENLEWVTRKENIKHAQKNDLVKRGERIEWSKLKKNEVLEIRSAYKFGCFTQREIAKAYDVSFSAISDIINRKSWKHI